MTCCGHTDPARQVSRPTALLTSPNAACSLWPLLVTQPTNHGACALREGVPAWHSTSEPRMKSSWHCRASWDASAVAIGGPRYSQPQQCGVSMNSKQAAEKEQSAPEKKNPSQVPCCDNLRGLLETRTRAVVTRRRAAFLRAKLSHSPYASRVQVCIPGTCTRGTGEI